MKRQRIELAEVAAPENLQAALWAAARGKHTRPDVAAFLADAPARLQPVRQALLDARLPVGRLHRFTIQDPKPRVIHAAPFADRVAHHALMRLMEPRLEQALVPTSFACRPGRGVHAALLHAQAQMQRERWYVKLDVRHCFPSIPHSLLLALLQRRFKGSALALAAHIVQAHAASPGHGLPIGSLTSQHFANQYLGELDRFALAHPACLAHVRYMDDVVLWAPGREQAHALCRAVQQWVPQQLALELKPAQVQRCEHGLALCGMRLGLHGMQLGQRRQRAWRQQWRSLKVAWQTHTLTAEQAQLQCNTLRSLAAPAQAAAWQRRVLGAGFDLDLRAAAPGGHG